MWTLLRSMTAASVGSVYVCARAPGTHTQSDFFAVFTMKPGFNSFIVITEKISDCSEFDHNNVLSIYPAGPV